MTKYCDYCKQDREYSILDEGETKTFICTVCNSVIDRETKKKRTRKTKEMKVKHISEIPLPTKEPQSTEDIKCISCGRPSRSVFRMLATEDGKAMCDQCIKFYVKHFIQETTVIPLHVETYEIIVNMYLDKRIHYDSEKQVLWIGNSNGNSNAMST